MSKEQSGSQVTEKDKLAGALDTIFQVVLGKELATIHRTMADQDTNFNRRFDGVREELTRSGEQINKDLRSRADELRQRITNTEEGLMKTLADLDQSMAHSGGELKSELRDVRTELQERIASFKQSIDRDLEARDVSLREQMENLSRDLATVQFELQQQIDSMQQVASVMGNLASVFATVPASAAAAHTAAGAGASPPSKEDMEDALDDLFAKKR